MTIRHKLLALGRSVIGMSDGASRYRMSKDNLVPDFGNPSSPAPLVAEEAKPSDVSASAGKAEVRIVEAGHRSSFLRWLNLRSWLRNRREGKLERVASQAVHDVGPCHPGAAFKTGTVGQRRAAQSGILLSQVRVVRNDLSDSGTEILALRRPGQGGSRVVRSSVTPRDAGRGELRQSAEEKPRVPVG